MSRLAGVTAAILVQCAFAPAQSFDPAMPDSVPKVEGNVTAPFALRYIEIAAGTGAAAKAGQQYTVHSTGWLRNGTKFDSSVDRKEPFEFVQGRRQVIAGWETGFEGMKVGGRRRLFIPYQLAYGKRGSGPIPGKAELVFDVELLEVKDVPEVAPAADLLIPLQQLEAKALGLAKQVPDDKYDWRPSPGVRSFREVFLHIANGNRLLLGISDGTLTGAALEKQIQVNEQSEKQPAGKQQVVERLAESFAEVRKTLESLRAGALSRDYEFFGRKVSRRTILTVLDTHLAEHVGQAIAYARMNGIVPPWSSGRSE